MSTLVQASPVLASPNGSFHLKMGTSTRATRNTAGGVPGETAQDPPSSAKVPASPAGVSSKSGKSARSTPSRPSVQTTGLNNAGGKASAGGLQPPSAARSGKSIDVGLAKAGAVMGVAADEAKLSAASGGQASSTFSMGPRSSAISTPNTSLPFPPDVVPRPLTIREAQLVDHLVRLQLFLATAPSAWQQFGSVATGIDQHTSNPWPPYSSNGTATQSESLSFVSCPHPALNRFLLPNGEFVTCVYWNGLYQITGTDIVRALAFRFEAFGRPVKLAAVKKFEEGVFSDLRNLKPGEDSSLEKPKSDFLDLLFKYGCIRTQKKQKVFFWFSVPHDRLFLDALERDLKREKEGLPTTTEIIGEPARSFRWDPNLSLFEQFADITSDAALENKLREEGVDPAAGESSSQGIQPKIERSDSAPLELKPTIDLPPGPDMQTPEDLAMAPDHLPQLPMPTGSERRNNPFTVSLFEGSPGYKQRKKKNKEKRLKGGLREGYASGDDELSASDSEGSLQMLQPGDQSFSFAGQAYAGPSVPQPGASRTMFSSQEAPTAGPIPPSMQMDQQHSLPSALDPHLMGQGQHMPYGAPGQQIPQMTAWNGQTSMLPGPSHAQGGFAPAPYGNVPYRPQYNQHPSYGSTVSISRHNNHATPALEATPDHASTRSQASQSGRMFRCPLDTCSRLFKRLEHLKRHVRTHTQERPYLCTRCPKRFSRSDNLTQHLKTHEKADRGERGMSTAEQSENDADFAARLDAQVEAMAGESYHGSQFGDDGSNFGSPAPMAGMRNGSVPAQFRSSSVDPGRYSMPPPSLPAAYGGLGQGRTRNQSYPYLDQQGGFGAARGPLGYQGGDSQQGGYPIRAQTRSPMPPPSQVPQRAMSASLGGRSASAHRYVPYPSRTPQPMVPPTAQPQQMQQMQPQQQQDQQSQQMMQPQPQYMQTPLHGYQDQGFAVPALPSASGGFVPQLHDPPSYQGSPAPTMPPRGESPAINPMALTGGQSAAATPAHNNAFQTFSAGLGGQMQQDAQDGSHIPIQSPATFNFDNMVATASYTTSGDPSASGWPMHNEGDQQHEQQM